MIGAELFCADRSVADKRIGLELELFPVVVDTVRQRCAPVPLRSEHLGQPTLLGLLGLVAEVGGGLLADQEHDIIAVDLPGRGKITLEPAGQIEYSGLPLQSPRLALEDLRAVVQMLSGAAAAMGISLLACGYNRFCDQEDLDLLVRKPRYLAMDRHLAAIGPFGRKMMRSTCSLQINIDFGRPEVVAERWRLANMIAPSLNALFASSPHRHDGRYYRSFRYEIWRHTDPTRTGRLYDCPDLDPVADYLRFALDATVMILRDDMGGCACPDRPFTFRQWLAGEGGHGFPDWDDWRTHLTTLFPDVRARGWMELRSLDALPPALWDVPVCMAFALLYDDDLRRLALNLLEGRSRRRDRFASEHDGYWEADYRTGVELLELAIPAIADPLLAASAAHYHQRYALRGATPADDRGGAHLPLVEMGLPENR